MSSTKQVEIWKRKGLVTDTHRHYYSTRTEKDFGRGNLQVNLHRQYLAWTLMNTPAFMKIMFIHGCFPTIDLRYINFHSKLSAVISFIVVPLLWVINAPVSPSQNCCHWSELVSQGLIIFHSYHYIKVISKQHIPRYISSYILTYHIYDNCKQKMAQCWPWCSPPFTENSLL